MLVAAMSFAAHAFGQMDEMFYRPDKEWIGLEGSVYDEITFESGGDTVHSVLFKPSGEPKATVVYFHGNASNISKWRGHIVPLTEDGFQVCIMDYRGYGKSTGTPTHTNIAEDARRLFGILMERDDVNGKPVIVYGASIGSQVAALIALENNDKVAALVLDGSMESFTEVAVATSPPEQEEIIRRYVTSPYSAKEAVPQLKNIRLLFIHSQEDFIPIAGARAMYESAAVEKEFWQYEGAHVMAPILFPEEFQSHIGRLLP